METKIVCPKCGAEFIIPEHESIAVGRTVGKDSNLGTIYPAVKDGCSHAAPKPGKAQLRLDALKAAGVDVSSIFSMRSAAGEEMLAKLNGDTLTFINDDDPVYGKILRSATIPERRLFRRWVMSQMFRLLANGEENYTTNLNAIPYSYQWRMTLEEFRVQERLARNDYENFSLRNRWFNKGTAVAMCEDYLKKIEKYIKALKVKRCKGREYIHLCHKNYFCSEIKAKVLDPLRKASKRVEAATDPATLYNALCAFVDAMPGRLPEATHKCAAWIDAYKGSGAYFTLQNLVLFHGCTLENKTGKPACVMDILNGIAEQYEGQGWRLFAYMKKVITDNGIDINEKRKNWNR